MLPQLRGRGCHLRRRFAESDGKSQSLYLAQGLVVHINHVAVGDHLGVKRHVLNSIDRGAYQAPLQALGQPLVTIFEGNSAIDNGDKFLAVFGPGTGRVELWAVLNFFRQAQHLAKVVPGLLRPVVGEHDPSSVGAFVPTNHGIGNFATGGTLGQAAAQEKGGKGNGQEVDQRAQQ